MKTKEISFTCKKDDQTIRGKEFVLEEQIEKKRTAVILSHAFMANKNSMKQYADFFASKGYAAFTYDFCGGSPTSKSDGKTTDMSVLTEVCDLITVVHYVQGLKNIDKKSVVLMGCSQGGFVSALVACKLQEIVKKLILFYPAFCIPHDARNGSMLLAKFDTNNIPNTISCGPMKLGHIYPEAVLTMDAYKEISKYKGQVCLVHGNADKIVDIAYAKKAKDVYENCYFKIIENAGHGFKGKKRKEALEFVETFLKY